MITYAGNTMTQCYPFPSVEIVQALFEYNGYQASFTNKEGKKQSKKFKTAEEAHKFYLENRKHNVA